MAVVTKDELMSQLKTVLGDNSTDEALALLENINDTFNATQSDEAIKKKDEEIEALNVKLEEQDKMWRDKYREAFFTGTPKGREDDPSTPKNEPKEDDDTPHSFEDLFGNNK